MMEWLTYPFIQKALLACLGLSLLTGPLGLFVVGQRLSFFGDTLAHSGLLGVSLAIVFQINPLFGIMTLAIVLAWLLMQLKSISVFGHDALLGMLSPVMLAAGMIFLKAQPTVKIDLMSFISGDILTIGWLDVGLMLSLAVVGLSVLLWSFSDLLRMAIDAELAQAEGVNVGLAKTKLMLLLAMTIALAVKMVGVILVTALLTIPAMTARLISRTPNQMIIWATVIGLLGALVGLVLSLYQDWPLGPAMVMSLFIGFIGVLTSKRLFSH